MALADLCCRRTNTFTDEGKRGEIYLIATGVFTLFINLHLNAMAIVICSFGKSMVLNFFYGKK